MGTALLCIQPSRKSLTSEICLCICQLVKHLWACHTIKISVQKNVLVVLLFVKIYETFYLLFWKFLPNLPQGLQKWLLYWFKIHQNRQVVSSSPQWTYRNGTRLGQGGSLPHGMSKQSPFFWQVISRYFTVLYFLISPFKQIISKILFMGKLCTCNVSSRKIGHRGLNSSVWLFLKLLIMLVFF